MFDSETDTEPGLLSSFQKFDEAQTLLRSLLASSLVDEPSAEENRIEQDYLGALTQTLDEYQEQSYLLDPHLEGLVTPAIDVLRDHVKAYTSGPQTPYSHTRVDRLSWIIYSFIKVRGYKTIVRYFPHGVSDLPMVVSYVSMDGPVRSDNAWALRYIILLWLSLVCMLPFDLAQFDDDDSSIARELENIGLSTLKKAGLERDGASLLLSRLYMRKDTSIHFSSFIESAEMEVQQSPNVFAVIGSLRVFADIAKAAPLELLQPHVARMQNYLNAVSSSELLSQNTVIRKLRTKCTSRIATRLLPVGPKSRKPTKHLDPSIRGEEDLAGVSNDQEGDILSEIESSLGELFELLQDKDTLVRWSAAKGIANISERLPSSFVDQIVDSILGHYSMYGSDISLSELPATAEHPWHGATLACAELSRRNLISLSKLDDVILRTTKALFFDVQKGPSSVGSNVRDAAAYVIWALARTHSKTVLERHALLLAQKLVTVALFDREVHIRRAASAAYQESVGRMGLFPYGIQILSLIDFYSVGIRRNAFLIAAPEVYRYEEYQEAILEHLLKVTLSHWDETMRRLAASSVKRICSTNMESNLPKVLGHLSTMLLSVDLKDMHGSLMALSELASALRELEDQGILQEYRHKIFHVLDSVRPTAISSSRNHFIAEAACYLIANALTSTELRSLQSSREPIWVTIILQGIKSRSSEVQEAAAAAVNTLSRLKDCSDDCRRFIKDLRRGTAIMQQSLARVLGSFDYLTHNNGFNEAFSCLLESVDPKSSSFFIDVEARRNAYTSLANIINLLASRLDAFLTPDLANRVWQAFFVGLDDYTVSERGDVGSWVRMSCIRGFASILQTLIGETRVVQAGSPPNRIKSYASFSRYLSPAVYHKVIGMVLKQGVERLDNVRQCVETAFLRLLQLDPPPFAHDEEWSVRGKVLFSSLLLSSESPGWNDGGWFYPKAVHFLAIKAYREPILRGLLLSIGSKTSTTQQLASSAMLSYARSLPFTTGRDDAPESDASESINLRALISCLLEIVQENPKSNNTVVPALHTFNIFLDGGVFFTLLEADEAMGLEFITKIMELVSKNVTRLQSMQRIHESMRIVVNVLGLGSEALKSGAVARLANFLLHPFPKIRSATAETMYVALQTKDIEYEGEAEEILLETEWSSGDNDVTSLRAPVKRLQECLK